MLLITDRSFIMTTETLIEKVRAELGPLDARGEQIVAATLKFFPNLDVASMNRAKEEAFVSRNISLEEYQALPRSERRRYQEEAEKLNRRWIEAQFEGLGAEWLIVIDSRVIKHGASLSEYLGNRELRAFSQKYGKCPFVFFSKALLVIEENTTSWHGTNKANDFYPAVAIALTGYNQRYETEADMDIGALGCHGSLELLNAKGVVDIGSYDLEYNGIHLSQPYVYFTDEAWIELSASDGSIRKTRTVILCVEDWDNSPFVSINPTRTVLLGRKVFSELQSRLTLDFAAKQTEVQFPVAAS